MTTLRNRDTKNATTHALVRRNGRVDFSISARKSGWMAKKRHLRPEREAVYDALTILAILRNPDS
jgi:hypothetical protein